MAAHGKKHEDHHDAPLADVKPITWHDARKQPRVRPQWNPVELANKLLDDMAAEGRLNNGRGTPRR